MENQSSITPIRDIVTGADRPITISGPCSAETEAQTVATCKAVAATGKVDILRAGIWKPRTRPGNFEGVGREGLAWLQRAKAETGLPVAVEVANTKHVYECLQHGIDMLWVGARTTVNPFSVQEIADSLRGVDIPVFVKNPINPDLGLWVGAIERFQKVGINRIAAIHRGFSFHGQSKYRNMPQWEIPLELKRRLPEIGLICDPSHICGNRELLAGVSQKSMDLQYDGLMIEAHVTPDEAWSDAAQQVTPEGLDEILSGLVLRDVSSTNADFQHSLEELRDQINHIDNDLLDLLSSRMKVAEQIGEYKKQNNITILQSARWNEIIAQTVSTCEAKGLSQDFVTKYLNAVHQESINHQVNVMNRK